MNKKIKLASLLLLPAILVGCDTATSSGSASYESSSSSSFSSSSSQVEVAPFTSLKDAFTYLSNPNSSYSLNIGKNMLSSAETRVYTPSYMYSYLYQSGAYVSSGYVKTEQGVSSYSFTEEGEVRTSEALKEDGVTITSLYDNSYVNSLVGLDLSLVPDGKEATTSKRNLSLRILEYSGLNESAYLLTGPITYSLEDSGSLVISFVTTNETGDVNYTLTFSNYGKASNPTLDSYVENGAQSYIPPEELVAVRSLFEKDNYTRFVRDDASQIVLSEYFNKDYYFLTCTDSYALENGLTSYNSGYVYLSKEEPMNVNGQLLLFDDIYYCHYYNGEFQIVTRENPSRPGYAQGGFVTVENDVSYCMNYPKNLLLFSNLDKLVYEDGVYKTDDYDIGLDFINNFGIGVPEGITAAWTTLDMKITGDVSSPAGLQIDFIFNMYNYTTGEEFEPLVFSFGDFGTTEFGPIENFMTTYGFKN